jgi:hypothetical protein
VRGPVEHIAAVVPHVDGVVERVDQLEPLSPQQGRLYLSLVLNSSFLLE